MPDGREHCCAEMTAVAEFRCDVHDDPWECPDQVVVYEPKFDEYGIPIREGDRAYMLLRFCPWCGAELPESRREEWFERLDAEGLDPWEDELPAEYTSDAWWREAE